MGLDAPSVREARREDAPLLAAAERAIALYRSFGFIEEGRKTRRLKIGPNEYLDDVYMALWVGP
jgi:hypothetical protein